MMSTATLNMTRNGGFRRVVLNVDCANALAPATNIVRSGPMSSSDAKSIVYETERLDALLPRGRRIFVPDASVDAIAIVANTHGFGSVCGRCVTRIQQAAQITAPTYIWAGRGR